MNHTLSHSTSPWSIMLNGGDGKRLRPYTETDAKALIPLFNNFPLSEFIIYALAVEVGLDKFILGTKGIKNYRDLQAYYQGGSGWSSKLGIKPQVHFEYQQPSYGDQGSGDSVKFNLRYYKIDSTVLVIPNDNLFHPEDIQNMLIKFANTEAEVMIGLTKVKKPNHYGIVEINNKTKQITSIQEKPTDLPHGEYLANTQIMCIKPTVFKYLHGDLAHHTLPKLINEYHVTGYTFSKPWLDFGTPRLHHQSWLYIMKNKPYPYINKFLSRICHKVQSGIWVRGKGKHSSPSSKRIINQIKDQKIKVKGQVIIGKQCQIANGVTLENTSVGDHTTIGPNTTITNSNIMDGWKIGRNCLIKNTIMGRVGQMADYCNIFDSVIGHSVTVEQKCQLKKIMTKNSETVSA